MVKGFKKDGKFRPTENRKKSGLTKSEIKKKWAEEDKSGLTNAGLGSHATYIGLQKHLKEQKSKVRKDEDIDVNIDDVQVSSHFRVIDDTGSSAKFLEDIRLPSKAFEDYDIERQMEKGLKELKKRGIVPEDAYAKFDDIGWEGMQLDLYIMTDDNYTSDLTEFKGIRLSLQTWIEDDSDNQDEIEDAINEKLKDQFNDNRLAGETIE